MKSITNCTAALAVMLGGCATLDEVSERQSEPGFVEAYLSEFNDHDVEGMRTYWAEDIQWLQVSGDQVDVVAESADQLANMMTDYFSAHPDVNSQSSNVIRSGDLLAFVETASWTGQAGAQSQEALAIYRVEDGKLAKFWYLAAE